MRVGGTFSRSRRQRRWGTRTLPIWFTISPLTPCTETESLHRIDFSAPNRRIPWTELILRLSLGCLSAAPFRTPTAPFLRTSSHGGPACFFGNPCTGRSFAREERLSAASPASTTGSALVG